MTRQQVVEHKERMFAKAQRVQVLEAILATYEYLPVDEQDLDYLRDLRTRIRKARTELKNSGFISGDVSE